MALPLGIRGFNPIWAEFDLSGKIFDDTYYMWVLENDIPYIPARVCHDPDLNTPWDQPIQFLGNGTLPVDIYYEPNKFYRLEFRQSDGLSPPTQQDPLIYLVENYVPGSGGQTPIDSVVFTSSNQVTNPQFALIDFALSPNTPFTFTGTDPDPLQIGPGWVLELAGTGSVTLTQVSLNSDTPTTSNAPYALQLNLTGWNDGSVFLRQRFFQSGVLWSNQFVSTTLTARVQGLNVTVSASMVDSMNRPLGQLLSTTVDSSFNEYRSQAKLLVSTDTDDPPAAYIDYKLALPSNADIYVTSIQLVVQDQPFTPSFEQDSINRQIDHTYNTAYPIVPIGTVIDFAGFTVPTHYFLADGSAKSRITYNLLYQALTKLETVTLTNGSNTFTVVSSADYAIGMAIEGIGIPGSTTITAISGTTITMSNNAGASGPTLVRFYAYGNGDGTTTFNIPLLADYVIAGVGGPLGTAGTNGVGSKIGSATHTITIAEMPAHNHPGSTTSLALGTAQSPGGGAGIIEPGSYAVNVASQGGGTAMPIVQQTILMKKCIRYE